MVNVRDLAHGQTCEGRYIYPLRTGDKLREVKRTTRLRCPVCRRCFLRLYVVRPIGRVLYVEGPPTPQQTQPVIYDPFPRHLAALRCGSVVCSGTIYPLPHRQLRKMELAALQAPATET